MLIDGIFRFLQDHLISSLTRQYQQCQLHADELQWMEQARCMHHDGSLQWCRIDAKIVSAKLKSGFAPAALT